MRNKAVTALCLLWAAVSLWAHHSTTAVFDLSKKVTVTGTLTRVDWVNPHIVLSVEAKNANGAVDAWRFEGNPPILLP